ncbi:MAG: hypothetical protein LJF30_10860 [Acidobacteria bacterium]|jgi:hypothetical protein|nr:hypothetical protein [Acidobacteriota bacterium]
MFVGHYGPSFLAKRADQSVPLWVLFLAVQLMDVFWALFVFLGIERVRIVPGFTKTNPLDLYYMPYTHSLPGALAWAVAAAIVYRLVTGSGKGGALVGAAVFSHWPLDLLVHRPDLALWDNTAKVGLGLWDYPILTLALEGLLVFGGLAVYLGVTRTRPGSRPYSLPTLAAVIFVLQVGMLVGPPPPSDRAMAATALLSYFAIAGVVAWLERGRQPRELATE